MAVHTEAEILKFIKARSPFEATLDDGSLYIKVKEFVPFIGTALHHGHRFPKELEALCHLNSDERYHEEDPFTGKLVISLPVVMIGQDSRYFYDLNLENKDCIYETAWGRKVWKKKLPDEFKDEAQRRHRQFYTIFSALVKAIVRQCKSCLVFDIHSFNITDRIYESAPTFNIGTHFLQAKKHNKLVKKYKNSLQKIELPNVDVTVSVDQIYRGTGYLAEYATTNIMGCLVLATDIKKVFADEFKPVAFPLVIESLKAGLQAAIIETSIEFSKIAFPADKASKQSLLSSQIDKIVVSIDKQIYDLTKGLNTLSFVNPINLLSEKKRFYAAKFKQNPNFKYRQLHINPYTFKEYLYRLPLEKINDLTLQKIYKSVVDSLATKIELLASVGTNHFLYNSLRYYGEPSANDIKNAKFILHLPNEAQEADILPLDEVLKQFEAFFKKHHLDCKVEVSNKIVAKALVSGANKAVIINRDIQVGPSELQALMHHEVGVHMVTSLNAMLQPLHFLRVGLPYNTLTQEGLSILSEYLCGHLSVRRLKILALRVLCVDLMIKGQDFKKVFGMLVDDYGLEPEDAFTMVTRIFRGGGFTKDYLYLRGFKLALRFYLKQNNLIPLLAGKTSIELLPEISELLEREILIPPRHKTFSFVEPAPENAVLKYIVQCIR